VTFREPLTCGKACHNLAEEYKDKTGISPETIQVHGVGHSLVIRAGKRKPLELRDHLILGISGEAIYLTEEIGIATLGLLKDATIGLLLDCEEDNVPAVQEPASYRHQLILRSGELSDLEEFAKVLSKQEG
jgi:hypothetical protein